LSIQDEKVIILIDYLNLILIDESNKKELITYNYILMMLTRN